MPIWPRLHWIVLLGPGLAYFWLDLLMHLLSADGSVGLAGLYWPSLGSLGHWGLSSCALSPSSRLAQASSYGSHSLPRVWEWKFQGLLRSNVGMDTASHLLHSIGQTSHKASLDSSGAEIDSTSWWEELQSIVAITIFDHTPLDCISMGVGPWPCSMDWCLETTAQKLRTVLHSGQSHIQSSLWVKLFKMWQFCLSH